MFRLLGAKEMNKYNNHKVHTEQGTFDSKGVEVFTDKIVELYEQNKLFKLLK